MEWANLEAPWRIDYIRRIAGDDSACFLCDAHAAPPDRHAERLVLQRTAGCLIIMNRYPYTNGHLMVAPAAHVGTLLDMEPADRAALIEAAATAERLVRDVLDPQGVNVGINVGRAAGAGVPGHLHVHVVPRWAGDTNFMHVFGHVRVNPQAIEDLYAEFQDALSRG